MRTKSNSRTKWLDDIAGLSFEDEVYVKKLEKFPRKMMARTVQPKDKRRKSVLSCNIPLGAAGETQNIPVINILEMTDPYPKNTRDIFTDCAFTDPTASSSLRKNNNAFFADGYSLHFELKSSRADDGTLLDDSQKGMLLQSFEERYKKLLKMILDWDDLPLIKTQSKMKSQHYSTKVQGRALVKFFPAISKLPPGTLPHILKLVAAEDVGNVIIDRMLGVIVAIRVFSIEDPQYIVMMDETVYTTTNDSGLKRHEKFYGRSDMEPYVKICLTNKHALFVDYPKAISASYNPKVIMKIPVEGSAEEKDEILKKKAQEYADEGTDVIAIEAGEESDVTVAENKTNNEMMRDIRLDIDNMIIAGMGSTKAQIGRTDGLNRDTATIMEVENIRNTRTPEEKQFAEFYESQLYNPLFYHLVRTTLNEDPAICPVKIAISRNKPTDEITLNNAFGDDSNGNNSSTEPQQDTLLQKKGEELERGQIKQQDAQVPALGAAGDDTGNNTIQLKILLAALAVQLLGNEKIRIDKLLGMIQTDPKKAIIPTRNYLKVLVQQRPELSSQIKPIANLVKPSALESLSGNVLKYMLAAGTVLTVSAAIDARKPEDAGDEESAPSTIMYSTETDDNVDDMCAAFEGQVYEKDSDSRPVLPIHWGCRCQWVDTETGNKLGQF